MPTIRAVCTAVVAMGLFLTPCPAHAAIDHVIHISVDGLRPDAITNQPPASMPNFYRLRAESAFTDNARTDVDFTITLPNHTAMLTGRPVAGPAGHGYVNNGDPAVGQTIHRNKGSYVASVFDVAHDHDLRTGLFATKTKFGLFHASYGPDATPLSGGARDVTGIDTGHNKIDVFHYNPSSAGMVQTWAGGMTGGVPYGYSFLHFHDTDTAGHTFDWNVTDPGSPYLAAARDVDARLGEILAMIESTPALAGRTAIVLTADHGGTPGTFTHGDPTGPQNYTVPLYVWGPGVTPGDLYALNPDHLDPGAGRPGFDAPLQPFRNGETGNLALSLLGLPPIPGSTIGNAPHAAVPEPALVSFAAVLLWTGFGRRRVGHV